MGTAFKKLVTAHQIFSKLFRYLLNVVTCSLHRRSLVFSFPKTKISNQLHNPTLPVIENLRSGVDHEQQIPREVDKPDKPVNIDRITIKRFPKGTYKEKRKLPNIDDPAELFIHRRIWKQCQDLIIRRRWERLDASQLTTDPVPTFSVGQGPVLSPSSKIFQELIRSVNMEDSTNDMDDIRKKQRLISDLRGINKATASSSKLVLPHSAVIVTGLELWLSPSPTKLPPSTCQNKKDFLQTIEQEQHFKLLFSDLENAVAARDRFRQDECMKTMTNEGNRLLKSQNVLKDVKAIQEPEALKHHPFRVMLRALRKAHSVWATKEDVPFVTEAPFLSLSDLFEM